MSGPPVPAVESNGIDASCAHSNLAFAMLRANQRFNLTPAVLGSRPADTSRRRLTAFRWAAKNSSLKEKG